VSETQEEVKQAQANITMTVENDDLFKRATVLGIRTLMGQVLSGPDRYKLRKALEPIRQATKAADDELQKLIEQFRVEDPSKVEKGALALDQSFGAAIPILTTRLEEWNKAKKEFLTRKVAIELPWKVPFRIHTTIGLSADQEDALAAVLEEPTEEELNPKPTQLKKPSAPKLILPNRE
jgi:hypothetical protein